MNIIEILLPISVALGLGFGAAFLYAVRNGQYEDCETPAHRMLFEPPTGNTKIENDNETNAGEPS